MASAAQILGNQANAQLSTGPRTPAGKARASRNNLQHGLTLGVLSIPDDELDAFAGFVSEMREDIFPTGALQEEAFQQFIDGAWRLRRIRALVDQLATLDQPDPRVNPEAAPTLHALLRHRAAAEMLVYRALQILRELQTATLYSAIHLTAEEAELVPPTVRPGQKIMLGHDLLAYEDRRIFYRLHGLRPFTDRFTPEATRAVREAARAFFST